MEGQGKRASRSIRVVALVILVSVVALTVCLALTYPRVIVSFPVSFTVGADVKFQEFGMPILHNWIQVEVVVSSGASLWNARILSQDEVLWGYRTTQGGQTTYRSEWIELLGGNYNFTFATIGIGSLEAKIKVTSKGGFW